MSSFFKENDLFFVLDVESMGLFGDAFSYAYLIGDLKGNVLEEKESFSIKSFMGARISNGRYTDVKWILQNVIPYAKLDDYTIQCDTDIYTNFIYAYKEVINKYGGKNLWICADCPHPVESSFLVKALDYLHIGADKMSLSPCPLIDVATYRISKGLDPWFDRLPNELPAHNPLNDVRQSYRGLLEAINK